MNKAKEHNDDWVLAFYQFEKESKFMANIVEFFGFLKVNGR